MSKHPISALIRLLPALLWLVAAIVAGAFFFDLYGASEADPTDSTVLDRLFPFAFLLVAMYALWSARREFKEAKPALLTDEPIELDLPRRTPAAAHLVRFGLSEPLQAKLREAIGVLAEAGVLSRHEAAEAMQCKEVDDEYEEMTFYEVMHILRELGSRRESSFANLVFFEDQVEVFERDIVHMVAQLARLAGKGEAIGAIVVKSIDGGPLAPARRGESSAPNAKVEFVLRSERCVVPFVMYRKSLPGRLFDGLADVLTRDQPAMCFVSGFPDMLAMAYMAREKVGALNACFPGALDLVGSPPSESLR